MARTVTTAIAGAGPGAFQVEWLRRRTIDERVRNAHSLELQTLADLGIVGLALLAAAIAATALAAAGALRADRALAAGPVAGALTWALHAGLDWDWEMPALTLVAIALAGLLLCRAGAADSARELAEERALEPQAERHHDQAEDPDLDERLGLRPA